MKHGKNIWISEAVARHLEKINEARSGGGLFKEDSYNKLLIEILGIEPYIKGKEERFGIHMLAVGDRKSFTFDDNNPLKSSFTANNLMKYIERFSKETGRGFKVHVTDKIATGYKCVFVTRLE